MRERILLLAVIGLFLLPIVCAPSAPVLTMDQESTAPESPAVPAFDGAESPQSIYSFNKTLPDDTLSFPDAFNMSNSETADSGASSAHSIRTYTSTQVKDETDYIAYEDASPYLVTMTLTVNIPSCTLGIEFFEFATYCSRAPDVAPETNEVGIYDGSSYIDYGDMTVADSWVNFTIRDPDTWAVGYVTVRYKLDMASDWPYISVDYTEIVFHYMTGIYEDHFGDSFSDISGWTERSSSGLGAGDRGFGTNGDMAEFWSKLDDTGNEAVNWKTVFSTPLSSQSYVEIRCKIESNLNAAGIYVLKSDLSTGIYFVGVSTTMSTYRIWVGSLAGIEASIYGLFVSLNDNPDSTNSGNYSLWIDFIRVYEWSWASQNDGSGWQHDGSTTVGATAENGGTLSTDGDYLTFTADAEAQVTFSVDPTTNASGISCYYTPFFELKIHASDVGNSIRLRAEYFYAVTGAWTWTTVLNQFTTTTATIRANLYALFGTQSVRSFQIWGYSSQVTRIDYVGVYSIAGGLVTQGTALIGDYYSVNAGGGLVRVATGGASSSYWMTWTTGTTSGGSWGPVLAVTTATYNVFNITTATSNPRSGYNDYVLQSYCSPTTTTYGYDEWRGATVGPTITGFSLVSYYSNTFAAVKFIEDSTPPEVVFSDKSPSSPSSASTITLSAVVTDAVEVYKVWFDAISYPSGFSDTPYYASEIATNLWTYSFASSLPEGFYCFATFATDGANTNTPDYYAYITFSVERVGLTCYIRIFDTLGEFVDFETFEVYKNGTRQYTEVFKGYSDEAYQIAVKDRWGETLNTTTFSAGTEELVIVVDIISLKVMSWHSDFVFFNLTHSAITYQEVITPLETTEFLLWPGPYSWKVDYRNGSIVSGSSTFSSSTAIVITGSTIADIAGYSATLLNMTSELNVTVYTTQNQVVTISLDLSNVNTTIYNQTISILTSIDNTNATIYDQTVTLLAAISNVNATLYAQTVELLADLSNVNTTIYNQTLSLLSTIQNVNATLYAQTLTVLADIENVNTTLYSQAVDILLQVYNMNSTLYSQTISLLLEVDDVEEKAIIIESVARKIYADLPEDPPDTGEVVSDIWWLILRVLVGGVIILVSAIILNAGIRARRNDERRKASGGSEEKQGQNGEEYHYEE